MSGTPTFPEIDYLCNWSNPKHLKPATRFNTTGL